MSLYSFVFMLAREGNLVVDLSDEHNPVLRFGALVVGKP